MPVYQKPLQFQFVSPILLNSKVKSRALAALPIVAVRGGRDSKAYGGQNGGASERHGWVAPDVTLYPSCASLSGALCAIECLRCLD